MSEISSEVGNTENLGRAIFDGRKAKDAARGKVHPRVFREKSGEKSISVDRLDIADAPKLIEIHDSERETQDFHGWAVVSYQQATEMNRKVIGIETESNPWHAEIQLCDMDVELQEEDQTQHAVNLANNALWRAKT